MNLNLARNEHYLNTLRFLAANFRFGAFETHPKSFSILPSSLVSSTKERPPKLWWFSEDTKAPEAGPRIQVLTLQDVFIKKKIK